MPGSAGLGAAGGRLQGLDLLSLGSGLRLGLRIHHIWNPLDCCQSFCGQNLKELGFRTDILLPQKAAHTFLPLPVADTNMTMGIRQGAQPRSLGLALSLAALHVFCSQKQAITLTPVSSFVGKPVVRPHGSLVTVGSTPKYPIMDDTITHLSKLPPPQLCFSRTARSLEIRPMPIMLTTLGKSYPVRQRRQERRGSKCSCWNFPSAQMRAIARLPE